MNGRIGRKHYTFCQPVEESFDACEITGDAGKSMFAREWTRQHGQYAGLRPSWLDYSYRGWPTVSAALLQALPAKSDIGTGRTTGRTG